MDSIREPLDANDLHGRRCRSLMQVKGLSRSYVVSAVRQGCCTLPVYSTLSLTANISVKCVSIVPG